MEICNLSKFETIFGVLVDPSLGVMIFQDFELVLKQENICLVISKSKSEY